MPRKFIIVFSWISLALAESVFSHASPIPLTLPGASLLVLLTLGLATIHALLADRLPTWAATPFFASVLYIFVALMREVNSAGTAHLFQLLALVGLGFLFWGLSSLTAKLVLPRRSGVVACAVLATTVVALRYAMEASYGESSRFSTVAELVRHTPWAVGLGLAAASLVSFRLGPGLTVAALTSALLPTLPEFDGFFSHGSAPKRPSVILLSVDTLRADAAREMTSYGRLASDGTSFIDAVSTSSWTVPSVASLHTGLYPHRHGADRTHRASLKVARFSPRLPTLATLFRRNGYRTAAFVSNGWCDFRSLGAGFDEWYHSRGFPRSGPLILGLLGLRGDLGKMQSNPDDAGDVIGAAISYLSQSRSSRFVWIHLQDPHLPYYQAALSEDDPLKELQRSGLHLLSPVRSGRLLLDPSLKDQIRQLYQNQVRYLDGHLIRLLDFLEQERARDPFIIAFTSDHGEEFWEHGGFEHGHTLYAEVVRVPLVIVRPGGPKGFVSEAPASLVDVLPTLLGAAGLTIPHGLDGTDLAGDVDPQRLRFMAGSLYYRTWSGLIQDRWVFLRTAETTELYDQEVDPEQKRNVAQEHPDLIATFQGRLGQLEKGFEAGSREIDENSLRSLGYIQ